MNLKPLTLLPEIFYQCDQSTRRDLFTGSVISENGYVERLITRVTDAAKRMAIPATCFTRALNQKESRKTGCDAMVVFRLGPLARIGMFEAKWPRISIPGYPWDAFQKGTKKSHFSDQISRQGAWLDSAAIWELIIVEQELGKQPSDYDALGSTCAWHTVADFLILNRPTDETLWTNEALSILNALQAFFTVTADGSSVRNIGDVIRSLLFTIPGKPCIGNKPLVGGRIHCVIEDSVILSSSEASLEVKLPCSVAQSNQATLSEPMSSLGITHFFLIDLTHLIE